MTFRLPAVVGLGVVVVLSVFLGQGLAQTPAGAALPAPTRLAVCDVSDIFQACEEFKAINRRLEGERQRIAAEEKQRDDEIKKVADMLNLLQGKEYEAKLEQLEQLSAERGTWAKLQQVRAEREQYRLTRDLYTRILQAVQTVAKERGYQVVLARDNISLASRDIEELLRKMANRKCLYWSSEVDLTADVLEYFNQQRSATSAPETAPAR